MFHMQGGDARAIQISHPLSRINIFAPIRVQVFSGINHFYSSGFTKQERDRRINRGEFPGREDWPDWYRTMNGSGSGSIVTFQGHILTNHHVVDGCTQLTVNGNNALLIGVDIVNDLALLKSDAFADRSPVRFRTADPRLGEDVVVIGYPVFGRSRSLNLTTGVVSARSGLFGDRRNIQITAPVQPGNSGGPVLDKKGQQIAVVVSKAGEAIRNVENMAWVIRGDIALDFLRDHGIKPLMDNQKPAAIDTVEAIAGMARRFTVRIECHQ